MKKLLLLLTLLATPASAGPFSDWFQSVHRSDGLWCCDEGDGNRVNYRIGSKGYEVKWQGEWMEIPDLLVVRNYGNPTGDAILFASPYNPAILYCFVPTNEG